MKPTPDLRPRKVAREPPLPRRLDRWQLTAGVGEGTLAKVYRARPAGSPSERPAAYAVKVLHPEWEGDRRATALLCREALVGRSVSHPHLIPVLEAHVGRSPHYVVMPWLDGATLAEHLARGPAMDLPGVLWIGRQVAEALGALHRAGWTHGDVKPGNIFVSPEGHVTLLDLSFARRPDQTDSAVQRVVMGTCRYMAPELITSAFGADIRSDIYSLGVVLYEVVSGRVPFEADTMAELASQHREARPPELRRLVPHVPAGVVRLIRETLAKEPLRRSQTPDELIARLAALEIATFTERSFEPAEEPAKRLDSVTALE